MNLFIWQTIYILSSAALLPVAPFLYLQGRYTRKKVGRLPDAEGASEGKFGGETDSVKLLAIGESTVAGVGARTHETALTGQFAKHLSNKIGKTVEWFAVGKSGIRAGETIDELVPKIPGVKFDYIMLGLGGNDVLKLSSPRKWRRDMTKLIGILKEKNPSAKIFITNAPAVRLSPALPQPIKFLLGHLSAMHDRNTKEFTREMENVFYFHQPTEVIEDFFADGLHPSEKGYDVWSETILDFCISNYGIKKL